MEAGYRDKLFEILCGLSDRQFDDRAKERLRAMIGRPNEDIKDELLGLIDDIVLYAWSSDFEINALDFIWKKIGGTDEELRNPVRTRDTPENRSKYKWRR